MIKTPTYRGRSVFLCQYFVLCEAKLPFLFFLLFYLFIWKRQFERRENREERKEKRTKKKRQSSAENCRFFLVRMFITKHLGDKIDSNSKHIPIRTVDYEATKSKGI